MTRPVLLVLSLAAFLPACASGAAGIGVASGYNLVSIPPSERKAAPALGGESLRPGPPISGAAFGGTVVVVNFWGTWCGPCRREEPLLVALSNEYRSRGVAFVGVNTRRDQRAAAIAFLDEFGVPYPSIYDPRSLVAHRFRVRVLPATVVLDTRGRIAARIIGALRNEADLRTVLDREIA